MPYLSPAVRFALVGAIALPVLPAIAPNLHAQPSDFAPVTDAVLKDPAAGWATVREANDVPSEPRTFKACLAP